LKHQTFAHRLLVVARRWTALDAFGPVNAIPVREFHSPPGCYIDIPVQLLYSLAAVMPLPLQILHFVYRCPLRQYDLFLRCKRQH
jgi:hypothetical protein